MRRGDLGPRALPGALANGNARMVAARSAMILHRRYATLRRRVTCLRRHLKYILQKCRKSNPNPNISRHLDDTAYVSPCLNPVTRAYLPCVLTKPRSHSLIRPPHQGPKGRAGKIASSPHPRGRVAAILPMNPFPIKARGGARSTRVLGAHTAAAAAEPLSSPPSTNHTHNRPARRPSAALACDPRRATVRARAITVSVT